MEGSRSDQDFLAWFRGATERAWAERQPRTFESFRASRVVGSDWQAGTRWEPFTEGEIAAAEQRWGLRFPPDYRAFLRALGATDRPMRGVAFEGAQLVPVERPGFYDWRTDDEAIEKALAWPRDGLLFDAEKGIWPSGWGPRPGTRDGRASALGALVEAGPPLIPVFGHRYLVGRPFEAGNPVLSVYGTDIIVYGANLQSYLMAELGQGLGLRENEVGEEPEPEIEWASIRSIPFWGDLIE